MIIYFFRKHVISGSLLWNGQFYIQHFWNPTDTLLFMRQQVAINILIHTY